MTRAAIGLLTSVLAMSPVHGHHSLSEYDATRRITVNVVVREFHFVNPHPYLAVDGPPTGAGPSTGPGAGRSGSAGQVWRLELDNRFELIDIGMTSRTFARGDQLVVTGAPGHDEKPILYVRELDRAADGFRYEQVGNTPRIVRPGTGRPR